MAAPEENNTTLFSIFILSTIALPLVPYTVLKLFRAVSKKERSIHCECSVCSSSGKYKQSNKQVTNFFTCHNLTVMLLWIIVGFLAYYIKHMKSEIQVFEPFAILGLEPGVSDSEIKKAYRNLSRQYHPDKNPDPEAHKYFVEYISKAYQALTDPISRENFEKYGHPDGRQGFEIGIALPQFLLNMNGESGGILLLCIIGVLILFPLVMAVVYLSRSSKYGGSYVRRETISSYFELMKPSVTQRNLLEILLEADEFKSIPIRRTDEGPLQKLFADFKDELNLNRKNIKQEELKFFERHPAVVKTELLIQAHLTRDTAAMSLDLQCNLKDILQLVPRLLEELMKMTLLARNDKGHGWLRPAIEVIELSQCIIQAVRLSSRKTPGGSTVDVAAFLQLPHFSDAVVKRMTHKKIQRFQEFQDMKTQERVVLLSEVGFSSAEALDVEKVLEMVPRTAVEVNCGTEGEEEIQEGDIVTVQAWVTLKRGNGLIKAIPHAPYYPFEKEENFWFLLADANHNSVWFSKKLSFRDEAAAVTDASRAIRKKMEVLGATDEETSAALKDAVNRAKNGSQLVLGKFLAPTSGTYNLTCYVMCDTWIGCDNTTKLVVRVAKGDRTSFQRSHVTEESSLSDYGSEEETEEEEEDYESEYSEDDEEDDDNDEVIEDTYKNKSNKGKGKQEKTAKASHKSPGITNGKGKQEKNTKASHKNPASRKRR